MDWIKGFYSKQNEWFPAYKGEVNISNRQNAQKILSHAGPDRKSILELGAGGGQNAAAAAELGFEVTALEILPELCETARNFIKQDLKGSLEIIETDFYNFQPKKGFDIITYWDGFGIGSDQDQQRLLQLISGWLNPDGLVLLEIYTPWYWASQTGKFRNMGTVCREYGFDASNCRMLDTWYPLEDKSQAVTQSLRCYSPADLALLLDKNELMITRIESGGAVNNKNGKFLKQVPLEQAMQYMARLEKRKDF